MNYDIDQIVFPGHAVANLSQRKLKLLLRHDQNEVDLLEIPYRQTVPCPSPTSNTLSGRALILATRFMKCECLWVGELMAFSSYA